MTNREMLALMVAGLLATIALTAIVACAVLGYAGRECPAVLLTIAAGATGALGGALALPHPTTGETHGPKPQPTADPPDGMPAGR